MIMPLIPWTLSIDAFLVHSGAGTAHPSTDNGLPYRNQIYRMTAASSPSERDRNVQTGRF